MKLSHLFPLVLLTVASVYAKNVTETEAIAIAEAYVHKTTPSVNLVSSIPPIAKWGPGRYEEHDMWTVKLAALSSSIEKEPPTSGAKQMKQATEWPQICRIEVCVRLDGTISSCVSLPKEKA